MRTVSFLRVKVYSAGFYVPEGTEKGGVVLGGEEAMGRFLESGQACVMRIGTFTLSPSRLLFRD